MYFYTTPVIRLDGSAGITSYIPFMNGLGLPDAVFENVAGLGFSATIISISAGIVENTLDQPLILTLLQDEIQIAQGTTIGGAEILQLTISDSAIIEGSELYYKLSSVPTSGVITISSIRMETI